MTKQTKWPTHVVAATWPPHRVAKFERSSAMETQCVYDSVSTGTYYGWVVKSFPVMRKERKKGVV